MINDRHIKKQHREQKGKNMKRVHFFLVRHGQTIYNSQERMQGVCDSPLTEEGVQQVRESAAALVPVHFTKAFSSPLGRAVATANIILENREVDLQTIDDLHEFDFGSWEARPFAELGDELFKRRMSRDFTSLGGEDEKTVRERSRRAFDCIVSQCSDRDEVLVVSHGLFADLTMAELFGIDTIAYRDECRKKGVSGFPNACIIEFEYDGDYHLLKYPSAGRDFQVTEW